VEVSRWAETRERRRRCSDGAILRRCGRRDDAVAAVLILRGALARRGVKLRDSYRARRQNRNRRGRHGARIANLSRWASVLGRRRWRGRRDTHRGQGIGARAAPRTPGNATPQKREK